MTSLFFFQTQAGHHRFNAGLAATTIEHDHERMMAERADVAAKMINEGEPVEVAQRFYDTGLFS